MRLLPFDRAAHRGDLCLRAAAGRGHKPHRLEKLRRPRAGIVHFRIIDTAAILQLADGIQPKKSGVQTAPQSRAICCVSSIR